MPEGRVTLKRTPHPLGLGLLLGAATSFGQDLPAQPNILVIMADDMGYSDIACFGGEIPMPNIDNLAEQGIRVTNFHNTGRCCPSRASLMTGLYSHRVGVGYMTGKTEFPAYQGALTRPHSSLGDVARSAGYLTAVSGKWHINPTDPTKVGFDRAETYTDSGTSYFYPFDRSGTKQTTLPQPTEEEKRISGATYVTEWYADGVVNGLNWAKQGGKPFLIYFAPTAPHYPLQAKQADVDAMKGRYDAGPLAIAEARVRKQRDLGIVDAAWPWTPPEVVAKPDTSWRTDVRTDADPWPPPPGTRFLNRKNQEMGCARPAASFEELMEIYAAQVVSLDREVGRIVAKLKENGQYENTLILFFADNGSSNERQTTGNAWAQVSNTPFPRYKRYTDGGGIRTPLILHWPAGIPGELRGSINRSYGHVIDVLPTVMELTGGHYPEQDAAGRGIPHPQGRSLVPVLHGETLRREEPLFFEHDGNLAVVTPEWKLVNTRNQPWRLYKTSIDPLEQTDVASGHPDVLRDLAAKWQAWADENGARPGGEDAKKGKARLRPDAEGMLRP